MAIKKQRQASEKELLVGITNQLASIQNDVFALTVAVCLESSDPCVKKHGDMLKKIAFPGITFPPEPFLTLPEGQDEDSIL